MPTQRERILAQCEYVANVFAAMFPTAPLVQCDNSIPEMMYVTIGIPDAVDYLHYLFTVHGDADDYVFEPEEDNHIDFTSTITWPGGYPEFDDDDLADDDSVADNDVLAFTISR